MVLVIFRLEKGTFSRTHLKKSMMTRREFYMLIEGIPKRLQHRHSLLLNLIGVYSGTLHSDKYGAYEKLAFLCSKERPGIEALKKGLLSAKRKKSLSSTIIACTNCFLRIGKKPERGWKHWNSWQHGTT